MDPVYLLTITILKNMNKNIREFKEFLTYAGPFLIMFGIIIVVVLYTAMDNLNDKEKNECNQPQVVNRLSTFNIYYKDGTIGTSKASRVIYGQTNDNIYFIGNNNDTLQVIPKITVEDVKEKNDKIKK